MIRRFSASVAACALVSLTIATPARAAEPPPPSSVSADSRSNAATGSNMLGVGIGLTTVGAVLALVVGVPALLLRKRVRDRAAEATYEVRQQRFARRAQRRETVAITTLSVGGAFILIGVPLLIAGASRKHRAERRATVTPVVSPQMAGFSARLRF